MEVGLLGLGRMGWNIMLHLLEQKVRVVAYNRSREKVDEAKIQGAVGAYSLEEVSQKLESTPKVVLLYVTSKAVEEVLFGFQDTKGLVDILPKGSVIIDGGNSFFQDSIRRAGQLEGKGLRFLDMGTSGGLDGARKGACLMVGGDRGVYNQIVPIISNIAVTGGYGYVGLSGSGHFVKMVHNAIEYGMMAAIAEGAAFIKESEFDVDLHTLTGVWSHGSIVSGLLMEKAAQAFGKEPDLSSVAGTVPEGETEKEIDWIVNQAKETPVIRASLEQRRSTRTKASFVGKIIAALRHEFGGHKLIETHR